MKQILWVDGTAWAIIRSMKILGMIAACLLLLILVIFVWYYIPSGIRVSTPLKLYEQTLTILLTAVTASLAILGFYIAALTFWGKKSIEEKVLAGVAKELDERVTRKVEEYLQENDIGKKIGGKIEEKEEPSDEEPSRIAEDLPSGEVEVRT